VASEHVKPTWSLHEYALKPPVGVPAPGPVSAAELAHLAQLSHLSLPASEEGRADVLADVEAVVAWVGTISSLDMSQYEPMATPLELDEYYAVPPSAEEPTASASGEQAADAPSLSDVSRPEALRLRPDAVTDGGLEKQLLGNASYKHRGFFVVPKVADLEDS
jgi:Asp-tRNA(Asn)/Glu-tRNA(Gln) amidotransferase C subunit